MIVHPVFLSRAVLLLIALCLFVSAGCGLFRSAAQDEAAAVGKSVDDFPETAVDLFGDMDGGMALTDAARKGRNTWMLWTAGNQAFWDWLANASSGQLDLLKILSSYPGDTYPYSRKNRFTYFGLSNEPGFQAPSQPDQWGLWLDKRVEPAPENLSRTVYGRASGIVGLRLFDNPNFDDDAKQQWDAERYYTDPAYYGKQDLVRPYRVGVACAFCHVGPHPLHPPDDPNHPEWKNLSSTVGAQYFQGGRVFLAHADELNFVWQLLNSAPPGALDMSLIATDSINNPRTMNAIYALRARLGMAEEERLSEKNLFVHGATPAMKVPHMLKNGADSVGLLGALSRAYLAMGVYHQEWITHVNLLVGGVKQTPMEVAVAQTHSVYWRATEQRVENVAAFLLKASERHALRDAPGGSAYITTNHATLNRGRQVFAQYCAACHSSKHPTMPGSAKYFSSYYKKWVQSDDFKRRMATVAEAPDFLDDNYLSNDHRYPVSHVKTNACASLASNGLRGHVWDNFTSDTYKSLPAVSPIDVQHPLDGRVSKHTMPGGGRGYYRSPSLVGMWSTAPYLHNNSLGTFTNDPSVAGRMRAFHDGVEKLLWPEKRHDTHCRETWGLPWCPPVYKTTQASYLTIDRQFLAPTLRAALLVDGGDTLKIGPIPKGTPINLFANIQNELSSDVPVKQQRALNILLKLKASLERIDTEQMNDTQASALFKTHVADLLSISSCPDFVVDRGHEYGTRLGNNDKRALIEYLKLL